MAAPQTLTERRKRAAIAVHVVAALVCTVYANVRSHLVPRWGHWYMAPNPDTLWQVRAFMQGRIAVMPHPSGAVNDYFWGRGGMHTAWGLGVPIIATPFHVIGRLFGAPGFPDNVRFLLLYAFVAFLLGRALELSAPRPRFGNAVLGALAGGFVMAFPTYVGMFSARFKVYEHVIAMGALWNVGLLAGLLFLLAKSTPRRLVITCAAAGFVTTIRPTLLPYALTTCALALVVARRDRLSWRDLAMGALAFVVTFSIFPLGNVLRFGGPFNTGYENSVSGSFVNRLDRWGLPFQHQAFSSQAAELFATLFLCEPVTNESYDPPPSVKPFAIGERYREYYAPTYDLLAAFVLVLAIGIVVWRIARTQPWRGSVSLRTERATLIGAWGVAPAIFLFVFYSRTGNLVTRYATDMFPAVAACFLCVGMTLVDEVRARAPRLVTPARFALCGIAALYIGAGSRGWALHLTTALDEKEVLAKISEIDHRGQVAVQPPTHVECKGPRHPPAIHSDLSEWNGDCTFASGMVFVLPYTPCVTFTFSSATGEWGKAQDDSVSTLRVVGDFERLKLACPAATEGENHRVTMCETHPPPFLLDDMRLYSIATLDDELRPVNTLKMQKIEATASCY